MSNIAPGDDPNADAAVDKLLANFSGNELTGQAICEVAGHYRSLGEQQKADRLYQYVVDTWADGADTLWSQTSVAMANIGLGNDPNAQAAIDKLIANFNDHSQLTETVFGIAEQYSIRGFSYKSQGRAEQAKDSLRKAIGLWERIIRELPFSGTFTPGAYYCSAGCYSDDLLGEYEKAIEYYRIIVDNWPGWDPVRVPYTYFGLARCYENMEKSGRISRQEAAVQIRQACEKILARCLKSQTFLTMAARRYLELYGSNENQETY